MSDQQKAGITGKPARPYIKGVHMKTADWILIAVIIASVLTIGYIEIFNTDQNCMNKCLADGNLYHYCLKFCSY